MDNHQEETNSIGTLPCGHHINGEYYKLVVEEIFIGKIEAMNRMYKLPVNEVPTLPRLPLKRIEDFHKTLSDEVNELKEVALKFETEHQNTEYLMTDMADLLGDVIVYCASEARKWGIPIFEVLMIIMASNESKLDENGQPIFNEQGKFLKGPNYWRPEPKILDMLLSKGCIKLGDW